MQGEGEERGGELESVHGGASSAADSVWDSDSDDVLMNPDKTPTRAMVRSTRQVRPEACTVFVVGRACAQ